MLLDKSLYLYTIYTEVYTSYFEIENFKIQIKYFEFKPLRMYYILIIIDVISRLF